MDPKTNDSEDDINSTNCDSTSAFISNTTNYQYREIGLESLQKLLDSEDISKNQKKKIKKQIKWLEDAERRKELRKKRKIRYKELKLLNPDLCAKKRILDKITTKDHFDDRIHFALDLSFDEIMTNKDLRKLGKQIGWCYQVNRRSPNPVQYHLCGLKGRLKSSLDPSHINWDLHFDEELFERFSVDKLIYLTAESSNVLNTIEQGKVYVIGGLVDHNHQKGICHKKAETKCVQTARLPLQENINIKTRQVLTVNHVFEILLTFLELRDWKAAILKVLPAKKLISENKSDDKSLEKTAADKSMSPTDSDKKDLPSIADKCEIEAPATD